jgi:hypothetical protein
VELEAIRLYLSLAVRYSQLHTGAEEAKVMAEEVNNILQAVDVVAAELELERLQREVKATEEVQVPKTEVAEV